jgi:hypothetical protein
MLLVEISILLFFLENNLLSCLDSMKVELFQGEDTFLIRFVVEVCTPLASGREKCIVGEGVKVDNLAIDHST